MMDATAPAQQLIRTPFPDGVFFGLPMEDYLAAPALGSTDMRHLRRNPTSFWEYSALNPDRKIKQADHLDLGTAMHTMLLEGEGAFTAQYLRGPDHYDDMSPTEKGMLTKAANKKAASLGMTALPAASYDRILEARVSIAANPDIATCFTGGISEVSVFWTRDNIRRKARLDYLKPRGVGDLKTVSNPHDMDFDRRCRKAIEDYDYHIQAAHYLEARWKIPDMIKAGKYSYRAAAVDPNVLDKIVSSSGLGWQWVFVCTDGPPDAISFQLTNANPILEHTRQHLEIAVARYVRYRLEFGDDRWRLIRPVRELTWDDMSGYFSRTSTEEQAEADRWAEDKHKMGDLVL